MQTLPRCGFSFLRAAGERASTHLPSSARRSLLRSQAFAFSSQALRSRRALTPFSSSSSTFPLFSRTRRPVQFQVSKPLSQNSRFLDDDHEYQNYGDPSFWDKTYSKESEPLEWYQSYSDVAPLIKKYVPTSCRVLMVGCGNAEISEDMVKDGYDDIVNIDNSTAVIEAMQKKYRNVSQLKYITMDVLDLSSFANSSFDCVIDKGTLDAIMCVVGGPYNVGLMIAEISRVLKPGGIYMLVTTGDPQSRFPLLNTNIFKWDVTLYIIPQPDSEMAPEDREKAYAEPVLLNPDGTYANDFVLENTDSLFVFICRKPELQFW